MKTLGILAFPASHSLSPQMQNAGFRAKNIDAEFVRFEIAPQNLAEFVTRVRAEKIAGLAVSLPHKEAIIPLLDEISETARTIGAVNTVSWKQEKLCGDNTDAEGFWKSIEEKISQEKNPKAAIIGAGGAARAMIFALREQGFSVKIFNRTAERAQKLAEEFSVSWGNIEEFSAKKYDLVANASSAGLKKPNESPLSEKSWKGFSGIAFDAVFDPLVTKFLHDAQNAGAEIITGEKMLLCQGMRQFEIWTGKEAPKKEMEKALEIQ